MINQFDRLPEICFIRDFPIIERVRRVRGSRNQAR
jgi:hypothetical protein